MTLLEHVVLVLHLLGMAAIIGSWLANLHDLRARAAMVWGARAQIVTGIILLGLVQANADAGDKPSMAKYTVKLVVALAVAGLVEAAAARQRHAGAAVVASEAGAEAGNAGSGRSSTAVLAPPAAPSLVQAAALLAVLNVCVAALWT